MHLSQITFSGVVNFPQILLVGQITKPTVKGQSRGDFSASGHCSDFSPRLYSLVMTNIAMENGP